MGYNEAPDGWWQDFVAALPHAPPSSPWSEPTGVRTWRRSGSTSMAT